MATGRAADRAAVRRQLLTKEPKRKTIATCAYGIDALGRVVLARRYFERGAFVESQFRYVEHGWEAVTYRQDGTLLGAAVGTGRRERIERVDSLAWDGARGEERVEHDADRLVRVTSTRKTATSTRVQVWEAEWDDAVS